MTPLFAFSPVAIAVLAILGVILFGRRLPEIGRSLGKTIVEFKKGVSGLEDDLDLAVKPNATPVPHQQPSAPTEPVRPPQRVAATAPKFEDTPTTSSPAPQA
jgi:sec-independent protein translocase protein TatA